MSVTKELRVVEGGKCTKVAVNVGDLVVKDQVLIVTEADKESREYKAPFSGKITKIGVAEGDIVRLGQLLAAVEEAEVVQEESAVPADEPDEDLIIIGGGVGGYVSAIYASRKGMHVTLIEKERLGGTCLNVGCIPTKTLIRSAEVNRLVKEAGIFGIDVEGAPTPDMGRIIDRKNNVVNQLVSGIEFLMKKNKGTASMKDDKTVVVTTADGEKEMTFRHLIIAAGSKVSRLNIPGIDLPCVLDSTAMLNYRTLPEKITIIGGGVIGLEFAFLYSDLGVEVTVLEYLDRLIAVVDKELATRIQKLGKDKGIRFETSARVTEIREENGKAVTMFEKGGEMQEDYSVARQAAQTPAE